MIRLNRGFVSLVDDEDFDEVAAVRWTVRRRGHTDYAGRCEMADGALRWIYLHRQIMNAAPGEKVDHRSGDGLDNRRANLRIATNAQNGWNSRPRRGTRSGFKGVWPTTNRKVRWMACISRYGQRQYLGVFGTPEEAARAYDAAARRLFGEFARVNFPQDDAACHAALVRAYEAAS